jgi:hypothetical protein
MCVEGRKEAGNNLLANSSLREKSDDDHQSLIVIPHEGDQTTTPMCDHSDCNKTEGRHSSSSAD